MSQTINIPANSVAAASPDPTSLTITAGVLGLGGTALGWDGSILRVGATAAFTVPGQLQVTGAQASQTVGLTCRTISGTILEGICALRSGTSQMQVGGITSGCSLLLVAGGVGALSISASTQVTTVSAGGLAMADGLNLAVGTSTGTQIGTTTSQKLGFFAATPVVQPATTGTASGFTAGAGTAVNDASTFTGGTGSTAYRISDVVKALKNLGLMAA